MTIREVRLFQSCLECAVEPDEGSHTLGRALKRGFVRGSAIPAGLPSVHDEGRLERARRLRDRTCATDDMAVDSINSGCRPSRENIRGNDGIETVSPVSYVPQQSVGLGFQTHRTQPQRVVLRVAAGESWVRSSEWAAATHLRGIVREAVVPDEIEVVLELPLRLVLPLLHLPEHHR